jgi:hypothetical protein
MWALAGMALPVWPLKLYFSPERIFERGALKLDRLHKKGLLTKAQCTAAKKELREWTLKEMKAHNAIQTPVPENDSGNPELEEDE